MTDDAILPESRRTPRRRALGAATIRLPSGEERRCQVRDVNATGARLKLEDKQMLTATFDLALESQSPRPCRLVWQEGQQAGVMFA